MPNLNDMKFAALRALGYTGTIGEMFLAWLQDNGATSDNINDAFYEVLQVQGYGPVLHVNDAWFLWLGDLGYSGQINDRELALWIDGGPNPTPPYVPPEYFAFVQNDALDIPLGFYAYTPPNFTPVSVNPVTPDQVAAPGRGGAYSEAAQMIAVGLNAAPFIRIYDTSIYPWEIIQENLTTVGVSGVAFSPDGSKLLASTDSANPNKVFNTADFSSWDTASYASRNCTVNTSSTVGVFCSSVAPWLRLYDLTQQNVELPLPSNPPTAAVYTAAYHPTQNILAVGVNGAGGPTVYIYNMDTNLLIGSLTLSTIIYQIRFNHAGNRIAMGGTASIPNVFLYDCSDLLNPTNWVNIPLPQQTVATQIYSIAFSYDDKYLIANGGEAPFQRGFDLTQDPVASIPDFDAYSTGNCRGAFFVRNSAVPAPPAPVFSANIFAIAINTNPYYRFYRASNYYEVFPLQPEAGEISSGLKIDIYSATNRAVLVGAGNPGINLYDTSTYPWTLIGNQASPVGAQAESVTFSNDGAYFYVGWSNVSSVRYETALFPHAGTAFGVSGQRAIRLNGPGNIVLTVNPVTGALLYDASTLALLPAPAIQPSSIAGPGACWHPIQTNLYVLTGGGTISADRLGLYDQATNTRVSNRDLASLTGYSCAFNPSGNRLALGLAGALLILDSSDLQAPMSAWPVIPVNDSPVDQTSWVEWNQSGTRLLVTTAYAPFLIEFDTTVEPWVRIANPPSSAPADALDGIYSTIKLPAEINSTPNDWHILTQGLNNGGGINNILNGVAYRAGKWIAVAEGGHAVQSDNGKTWEPLLPQGLNTGTVTNNLRVIASNLGSPNNQVFMVGTSNLRQCSRSIDGGITWVPMTMNSGGGVSIKGFAWSDGGQWVCVLADGWAARTTNNGGTWTALPQGLGHSPVTVQWRAIAANASGVIVAVADGGKYSVSTDFGESFSARTIPTGETITCVSTNGLKFLLAGVAGKAWTLDQNGNFLTALLPDGLNTGSPIANFRFAKSDLNGNTIIVANTGWSSASSNHFSTFSTVGKNLSWVGNTDINGIATDGQGKWVAVGADGRASISPLPPASFSLDFDEEFN